MHVECQGSETVSGAAPLPAAGLGVPFVPLLPPLCQGPCTRRENRELAAEVRHLRALCGRLGEEHTFT